MSSSSLVTQHSCLDVHKESDQKTDLCLKINLLEYNIVNLVGFTL